MRLRTPIEYLGGRELEAEVISERLGGEQARYVLVVRGETLSPLIAAHADYEVLSASEEERLGLLASGYHLRGLFLADVKSRSASRAMPS